MNTMKRREKRGFTLIELLIVVVIIGILASIVIPKYSSVRQKAFRATMMADLKNLASEQELYHNTYYTYSTSLTALEALPSSGVTITINEGDGTGWAATASHAGVPSQQCGVFHGDATSTNGDPATNPGVIACSF